MCGRQGAPHADFKSATIAKDEVSKKEYLPGLDFNRPYDSMKQHVSPRFLGLKVDRLGSEFLPAGRTNLGGCRLPEVYICMYIKENINRDT